MKKTYMILLGLVLSVVGASSAMAQKIYQAELDASMFKAWTSWEAGATVVEEPEAIDDGQATFNCENNLYKQLEGGNVVFGNTNVYYLWYADLTGTKTFYAEGTPGLQLRVLMNRPEPIEPGAEGYDVHGGKTLERMLVIGEDGKGSIDVSDLEYVHLNCIKVNWGGSGIVKAFYMEGTVKPVIGLLSMINNGNAEGDDLASFPVSYDGPNNGDSAPDSPQIVDGGVSGRCFKVTAFDSPTETWHTQFYIKADEVMAKGTKWKLNMSIKADKASHVTTSAQAQPRQWKGGFISEFTVGTEWQHFSWEGEIGVDDFQSIAFDLNNGDERNADDNGWVPGNGGVSFYFDNIEFGVDLGGSNPLSNVKVNAGYDVIQVDFAGMTNMKELVKNALTQTLIYDNSCATVTIDGKECEILSVEGLSNGELCIFMAESAPLVESEKNVVKVGFKNPTDAEHQLLFTAGKFEGQPVPEFSGLEATFLESLGDGEPYISYLYGAPMVAEVSPENGSFNLPADFSEFTVTFNQKVKVSSVIAKLGNESLRASGDGESAKVIKLTRTSNEALSGSKKLVISQAWGEKGEEFGLEDEIVLNYSFGPVATDDEPTVVYASNFSGEGEDANGAGWFTNADGGGLQPASSGSGSRILHNQGAFVEDLVYIAQRSTPGNGVALFGIDEGTDEVPAKKLTLEAKTYRVTLGACRHDRTNVALLVQVLPEDAVSAEDGSVTDEEAILVEDRQEITPEKTSKKAVRFDLNFQAPKAGNYVIRLVPSLANGSYAGYDDAVCFGDVKVEYIPDVMGILETKALNEALQTAKDAYDDIAIASAENDNRYEGEAMTDLKNLIDKVELEKAGYTAPSLYTAVAALLEAAVKAANDHKAACDSYDEAIKQGIDLVAQFKDSKFAPTSYYTNLTAVINKYHGSKEEVNLGDEEDPLIETTYSFDVLKEDAALTAANTELSEVNTMASKMFTEGKSSKGWNQITTGYAALHERLRRGVELLKSLGLAETEDVIVKAEAELGDNDQIADVIVTRATSIILTDLAKGAESQLFVDDPEAETSPSYDLSVFFKNPNCYGPAYSTEVPGWTSVQGNGFAWSSWDAAQNHSASTPYPEDCDIHAGWHPNPYAMVEQTVENLPAGIYTIKVKCNDNGNSWEDSGTCAYYRTSESPEIEPGADVDRESDFAGYLTASGDFEEVEVVDGKLTVGFYYGNTSQAFFEDVEVWMTAPIAGHDYGKDKQDFDTGIEAPAVAKVRALELYNLNGRRIITAQKGIQIVKKHMSDGTVRVEKVIKK